MRKKIINFILILTLVLCLPIFMGAQSAGDVVYLGGFVTGFDIKIKGAVVLGLSDVITENGIFSPAKDAGVESGDRIVSVGETEINSALDITKALNNYKGGMVIVTLYRGDEKLIKEIEPKTDLSGRRKLGVFVRDGIEGIGTLTFVKSDRTFMALGHPVTDDGGRVVEIVGGELFGCSVYGAVKGQRNKAGELKGMIIGDKPIGVLSANALQGIKGQLSDDFDLSELDKVEVGVGRIGNAEMITCTDGVTPQSFSVSIVKAEFGDKADKNFVIKVNDKRLIDYSGGIVQGMSGSPIIQDGKLVGAVTHVFINDPTRGYGISIENMLKAAA